MPLPIAKLRKTISYIMLFSAFAHYIAPHTLIAMQEVDKRLDSDQETHEEEIPLLHSQDENDIIPLDDPDQTPAETKRAGIPTIGNMLIQETAQPQTQHSWKWILGSLMTTDVITAGFVLLKNHWCPLQQGSNDLCQTLQSALPPVVVGVIGANIVTLSGLAANWLTQRDAQEQSNSQSSPPASPANPPTATALINQSDTPPPTPLVNIQAINNSSMMI